MKKAFYFISAICLLTACSHKCDEFNEDILRWTPYHTNDTISFDKNGQTTQFLVTSTFLEHTSSYKGKCACEDYFGFESGDATRHINFTSYDDQTTDNFILDIRDGNNFGTHFNNRQHLNSINIGTTTFNDVLIMSGDSLSATETIWKVIFAKDKGIIAIYYNDSVMITNKNLIRTTTTSQFNMNETKCD
jgi:hypothetical protein